MDNPFQNAGKKYYPGSSLKGKVYQDMSFLGFNHPSHRKGTEARVKAILDYLPNNKDLQGLDMGCSNGALSIGLAKSPKVASMTGVDQDPAALEVAHYVANDVDWGQKLKFHEMDLASERFFEFLHAHQFDFILWFSNWMWIAREAGWDKAQELLQIASKSSPMMFFETAQSKNDGFAGAEYTVPGVIGVVSLLADNTCYTEFKDLGILDRKDEARRRNTILATR